MRKQTHLQNRLVDINSAIKNEILPLVTRMNLEGIMLNEISQRKTNV